MGIANDCHAPLRFPLRGSVASHAAPFVFPMKPLILRLTILAAIATLVPFIALGIAVNLRADYKFSAATAMFWSDWIAAMVALTLAHKLAR